MAGLISNGTFEDDTVGNGNTPSGWTSYNTSGIQTYKGVANDFALKGTKSFKITGNGSTDTGIKIQTTGVPLRSTVTLTVWVKTDASVTNGSVVLDTAQDGAGGALTSNANQGANTNEKVSVSFITDSTTVNVYLGLGSFGGSSAGTVWFDDVELFIGTGLANYSRYVRVGEGVARSESAT